MPAVNELVHTRQIQSWVNLRKKRMKRKGVKTDEAVDGDVT